MRLFVSAALATPLLLAACTPADRAGEGSSRPDKAAQTCIVERGMAPGTAAYDGCVAAERQRQNSAMRGVVDTLFRNATEPPLP